MSIESVKRRSWLCLCFEAKVNKKQYEKICDELEEHTLFTTMKKSEEKAFKLLTKRFKSTLKRIILPVKEEFSQPKINGEFNFSVTPPLYIINLAQKIFKEESLPKDVPIGFKKIVQTLRNSLVKIQQDKKESTVRLRLMLNVSSNVAQSFKIDAISKVCKRIESILGVLEKCDVSPSSSNVCASLKLDAEKYKILGGLAIPRDIKLTTELTNKLGESEVKGVSIGFKKSPIGVDLIEIEEENGTLRITTRTSYEFLLSEDLGTTLGNNYNYVRDITGLIVERK